MKRHCGSVLPVLAACVVSMAGCEKSAAQNAAAAMEKGDYWSAIALYSQAEARAPYDNSIKTNLMDARLRLGKQFAIEAVQGMHADPSEWGKLIAQLEFCGEACKIELWDSYYGLAAVYEKAGKIDLAFEVLKKVLAADPSRRIAVGKINDLITSSKDTAWGRKAFEAIWFKYGTDPAVCYKYGRFLASRDFYQEAMDQYKKCLPLGEGEFSYVNEIKMEISAIERRKRTVEERMSPQPGAPLSGDSDEE